MSAEDNIDEIVSEEFFSKKFGTGVAIEVGAADPEYLSIGSHFRKSGWKVISIEANPYFCAAHRKKGNIIYQYACSDHNEDLVDFHIVNSFGREYKGGKVSFESFSSLGIRGKSAELYSHIANVSTSTIKVNVRTLDTILQSHEADLTAIDLLAVDVEGWEIEVIQGFSLSKYAPTVIILENLFEEDHYVEFMKECGYSLWRRIVPNDIYTRCNK